MIGLTELLIVVVLNIRSLGLLKCTEDALCMINSLDDIVVLTFQEANGEHTSIELFYIILMWLSFGIVLRDAAVSVFQLSYELCYADNGGFWKSIDFYYMVLFGDFIVCSYIGSIIMIMAQTGVDKSINFQLFVIELFNCFALCLKFYALHSFVWSKTD